MKPLNLAAFLIFLAATVWTLTLGTHNVQQFHKLYYKLISPFLKSGGKAESYAHAFIREAEHSDVLKKRLSAIQSDFGRLQVIEGRFRELERENIELRSALAFKKRSRFSIVPSRIIRRKPSTWWETVVINRGQDRQISVQDPVLSDQGLVGKINTTAEGTSTVLLLTDESCQVSAKVENTLEMGIVSGQRIHHGTSPELKLRFLSRQASIKQGAKVFTTGRGGLFPPDLLIGTVISHQRNALDSEAILKPAVDFEVLDTLFVVVDESTQVTDKKNP